jgi:hypothetical protein
MKIEVIIVFIILFAIMLVYHKMNKYDFTYITSNIDGKYYLVRDLYDKQQASDMLALFKKNINDLIIHLNNKKDPKFEPYIERLNEKLKNTIFSENLYDSKYTSYSINKGEELVFCLRSKKTNEFHDINLVMYVVIHEISHIACPEYNAKDPHTALFKELFKYLLLVCMELGIYKKIDFKNNPIEYCGMKITDSIV